MFFALLFSLLADPVAAARPAWIEVLPQVSGRIYALGAADLGGNEGQAITRASDRARLEVVTRLRASVKGRTSVATQVAEGAPNGSGAAGSGAAGSGGARQVRDEVSVSARAEDLPGLVVERTYVETPVAGGQARSVYALAYLDLAQARGTLASRLARIHESRSRVGTELSRKARWRFRKIKGDLDRLDDAIGLLAPTGAGLDLLPELKRERAAVDSRLDLLDKAQLPPLDLSRISVGFRTNVELPPGIEAYLLAQIGLCGVVRRELDPDLILDLSFACGSEGAAFICPVMDVYHGVCYRLDAQLKLLEGSGEPLGRPVPIQILQSASPEGMVNEFRRQFERRLPRLFADFKREFQ